MCNNLQATSADGSFPHALAERIVKKECQCSTLSKPASRVCTYAIRITQSRSCPPTGKHQEAKASTCEGERETLEGVDCNRPRG